MKKPYLALACCLVLTACADTATVTTATAPEPQRNIASVESAYSQNVQTLMAIPLVKGIEVRKDTEYDATSVLIGIFNKIENESAGQGQSLSRGTHAKGTCFESEFKVFSSSELKNRFHLSDTQISRLKQGLFAQDGIHRSELRFANAKGAKNPDTVDDVRGLSFTVETHGDNKDYSGTHRQDFMMNSSPMFVVNNIDEFVELMKAARLAGGDFDYFPNPLYIKSVLHARDLLKTYERADVASYATEEYWANLPYTHGVRADGQPVDIVKYKVTPCDGHGIRREASAGKAADYLQADIRERALGGKVCFLFQVQFFDLQRLKKSLNGKHQNLNTSDWIENGGELWDESVLPFTTVAQLEIAPASSDPSQGFSPEVSCDTQFISTRLHANVANQPMGSIARVRTLVEENSRARRMREMP